MQTIKISKDLLHAHKIDYSCPEENRGLQNINKFVIFKPAAPASPALI